MALNNKSLIRKIVESLSKYVSNFMMLAHILENVGKS